MRSTRRGFTLAEVLISMTIGAVVLTAATSFSLRSWQTRRGWTVRESVDRNARFLGLSLARDAQEAGIAMESSPVFASLGSFGDTLSVLSVPFTPNEATVYPIYNDGDTLPNYPAGGNCGAYCIEFNQVAGTFTLAAGDLARLQIGSTRRLLYLTSATSASGGRFRVNFLPVSQLLGRASGLSGVLLTRAGTTIQKLKAVVYWRDAASASLMRADQFDNAARPLGRVLASGAAAFSTSLIIVGNNESPSYNGLDADTLNDGNDVIGVRVRAQLQTERVDPAVNNGQPILRWYDWRVAPRNLLYEKNRNQ